MGTETNLQRRLRASVCNDAGCVEKKLVVHSDPEARVVRMLKGFGVCKLLTKNQSMWSEKLASDGAVAIPRFAWAAETIAFTCSAPRGCVYELLIDGVRKQSVAARFNKTSELLFSTTLAPPATRSFPYQLVGFEGDRLPTVFWTVDGTFDTVEVSGTQGYRLNEAESCLEGARVPTEPESHFVSVSFQGRGQKAFVNTTVDVLRGFQCGD